MSNNGSSLEQLMDIRGGTEVILYDAARDRFDMPFCAETSIRQDLNANRIVINGDTIAIAMQYPYPHQVEAQLELLVDNRTPVLVILASVTDIQNHQLPKYFSGSATFGQIQTQSKFEDYIDLGNDIEAKLFKLSISGYQEPAEIPVLHIHNWPDQRTVSPETTASLVALIESTVAESRATIQNGGNPLNGDNQRMLPVIHCKAGVGRTGQTIAAMAMQRYPELGLEAITRDLRASRNDRMIQTPRQMKTLIKMTEMSDSQGQQQEKAPPLDKKEEKPSSSWWSSLFRGA